MHILSHRTICLTDGRKSAILKCVKGSSLRHRGVCGLPSQLKSPAAWKEARLLLSDAAKVSLLPYLEFYRICTEDTL